MNILNPARAVMALVSFLVLLAVSLPGHAVVDLSDSEEYDSKEYSQGPGCFNMKHRTPVEAAGLELLRSKKIRYRNECQFAVVGVFCFMEVGHNVDAELNIGTCEDGVNFPLPLEIDNKTAKNKYRWKANGEGAVLESLKAAHRKRGKKLEIANGAKGNLKIPFASHKVNVVWSVCDVQQLDKTCDFKPASVLWKGRCSKDPNAFGCSDRADSKGGEEPKGTLLTNGSSSADELKEPDPTAKEPGNQTRSPEKGEMSDSSCDGDLEYVPTLLEWIPTLFGLFDWSCGAAGVIALLSKMGDTLKVIGAFGLIVTLLVFVVPPFGRYLSGRRESMGEYIKGKTKK